MSPLPGQVAPALGGRGWDMEATIERPEGTGGVLYASGTENSGVSLFVQGDRLVFDYNCFGDHHVVESESAVPIGPSVVGLQFRRTGRSAEATLVIDGKPCGHLSVPFAMTMISSVGPSIGYDHGSPVSERYRGHYPFAGRLSRLDVSLVRGGNPEDAAGAEAEGRAAMARQ
jgi:arylsulfatase